MQLYAVIPVLDPINLSLVTSKRQIASIVKVSERRVGRRKLPCVIGDFLVVEKQVLRDGRKNNSNPKIVK